MSQTLDMRAIEALRELQTPDDPDFLARLLRLFLQNAPQRLERIGKAIRRGDPREVFLETHSLKSSSANVGAMTLSGLCRTLEETGRSGNLENAAGMLARLEEEFLAAKARIESLPELSRNAA